MEPGYTTMEPGYTTLPPGRAWQQPDGSGEEERRGQHCSKTFCSPLHRWPPPYRRPSGASADRQQRSLIPGGLRSYGIESTAGRTEEQTLLS